VQFTEVLEIIVRALETISAWRNKSGTRATSLLRAICDAVYYCSSSREWNGSFVFGYYL